MTGPIAPSETSPTATYPLDRKSRNAGRYNVEKEGYEADVALLDRYQSFSTEIVRIGILGMGLVGFFLSTFKPLSLTATISIVVGTVCCGLAVGFALAHRYVSTEGIFYHVRGLRRQRRKEQRVDEATRNRQYNCSANLLLTAAALLGLAALASAVALTAAIMQVHRAPPTTYKVGQTAPSSEGLR